MKMIYRRRMCCGCMECEVVRLTRASNAGQSKTKKRCNIQLLKLLESGSSDVL